MEGSFVGVVEFHTIRIDFLPTFTPSFSFHFIPGERGGGVYGDTLLNST